MTPVLVTPVWPDVLPVGWAGVTFARRTFGVGRVSIPRAARLLLTQRNIEQGYAHTAKGQAHNNARGGCRAGDIRTGFIRLDYVGEGSDSLY